MHILVTIILLAISLVFVSGESRDGAAIAVQISFAVMSALLVRDLWILWSRKEGLARTMITTSVVYWFWLNAFQMSLASPVFPRPAATYPYMGYIVPTDVVAQSILLVLWFQLFLYFALAALPLPRRLLGRLSGRTDRITGTPQDVLAALLAGLGWIPVYVTYGGDFGRAFEELVNMRSAFGGAVQSPGLLVHLHIIAVFGGALAVARTLIGARGSHLFRAAAIGLSVPLLFLGGSRFVWGYLVLPAAVAMLARHWRHIEWTRRRLALVVVLSLCFASTLLVGAVRQEGIERRSLVSSLKVETLVDRGLFGHEQFGALVIAVDLVPKHHAFFGEFFLPYFPIHFIPRAWWPEKPIPETWFFYNATVTGGGAFNVTPSVIGQYWMSLGWLGVAGIGLLLGWLAKTACAWIQLVEIERQILGAIEASLTLLFVFFSFRYFHPLYFTYPFFGFLIYWAGTRRASSMRGGTAVLNQGKL